MKKNKKIKRVSKKALRKVKGGVASLRFGAAPLSITNTRSGATPGVCPKCGSGFVNM